MLLQKLQKKLRSEYTELRTYLTTVPMTAEELLDKAYEVVWKQEIVVLFEAMTKDGCRYPEELLGWILSKEYSLGFLYEVWMSTDYLLTEEFADLLFDELTIRKERHQDE